MFSKKTLIGRVRSREPIVNPQLLKQLAVYNFKEDLPKGTIRHFAFEVDNVDNYIQLCNQNGYEIFLGPKDVVLGDIKARVAFTYGPLEEEVEFFEVKK